MRNMESIVGGKVNRL